MRTDRHPNAHRLLAINERIEYGGLPSRAARPGARTPHARPASIEATVRPQPEPDTGTPPRTAPARTQRRPAPAAPERIARHDIEEEQSVSRPLAVPRSARAKAARPHRYQGARTAAGTGPGAARTPGAHCAPPARPHPSRGTRNTGPSTKGHRRVQRLTSSRPLGFQVSARAKPARPIEGCDGAGREIGVKPRCRYIFYSTHGYRRITRERAGWPPPLGASSAVRSLDGGTVDPSVLGSIYIVTSAMMWAC